MSTLSVVAITAERDFLALRDAWNALLENASAPSVFLYHEWFEAAWAWRKQDSTLFVLCAYEDQRLVGLLPLVFVRDKKMLYEERRLEFLSVPDTQVCDVVAADIDRARIAQAFAGEMERRRSQWDKLHFSYLPDESVVGRELCREFELRGFRSRFDDMGRNPSIALNGTWSDYYSSRSRRLKKANNLIANRLKKAGEVRVDWLEPGNGDASDTITAVDIAIGISGRSWKRETGNSLNNPGPLAFIRMLSAHAHRRGWLAPKSHSSIEATPRYVRRSRPTRGPAIGGRGGGVAHRRGDSSTTIASKTGSGGGEVSAGSTSMMWTDR